MATMANPILIAPILLLCLNILLISCSEREEIILHLGELGSVKGLQIKSAKSNIGISDYNAFYGIPYAYPPVGKLRFKPTKILEQFNEKDNIFDATDAVATSKAHCPFMSWVSPLGLSIPPVLGQEDCLNLNVYSPNGIPCQDDHESCSEWASIGECDINPNWMPMNCKKSCNICDQKKKLPVMVWIHGGAFLTGSNDPFMYGPEYFYSQTKQNEEVILVTINYRLGVLGFLSLEKEIAPGNLGLRDQNLALQWVNKHISNFGGDPSKVTLFGLSAGAQSTNYHILSPLSTYLFDQAIMHSDYRPGIEPNPLSYATNLASELGCEEWEDDEAKEILSCLQSLPYRKLIEKGNMWETFMWHYRMWKPIVDGKFLPKPIGENEKESVMAFLPEHPNTLMKNGEFNKVSIIMGGTENELACTMHQYINEGGWKLKKFADNFDQIGPEFLLGVAPDDVTEEDTATANIIRIEYLNADTCGGDTNLTIGNIHHIERMLTDTTFLVPIDRKVKEFTKHLSLENLPVYYYRYRHKGSITLPKIRFNMTIDFGVSHGDDNFILYRQHDSVEAFKTKEDAEMTKKLIAMWTHFATHGSPTEGEAWHQVALSEVDEPKYAVLDNNDLVMLREDSFSKRSKMISELEELSETFKQMNVTDHPAVKSRIADKQKAFEEEHKEELEKHKEELEKNDDKEEQQPMNQVHGIPEDILREKLVDETERNRGKNLEDSVMDYISENFLTDEKKGEEDEEEDLNWAENVDQKDEL